MYLYSKTILKAIVV